MNEWIAAEPGEVWAFDFKTGAQMAAAYTSLAGEGKWIGVIFGLEVSLDGVTSGRRIWPEAVTS